MNVWFFACCSALGWGVSFLMKSSYFFWLGSLCSIAHMAQMLRLTSRTWDRQGTDLIFVRRFFIVTYHDRCSEQKHLLAC